MTSLRVVAPLVAASVLLAGCATDYGPKQGAGGLLGGIGGAVAGAQFGKGRGQLVGVGVGTLLGAMIGTEVGKSLDRADYAYMQRTQQYSFERVPSGYATNWRNPDSGHYGAVTPLAAYQTPGGQYCREFHQSVIVGGQHQEAYGTACRMPDGSWRVVQ